MQTISYAVSPASLSPLASEVRQKLVVSGETRLRNIQVDEEQGIVVLSGRVPSYYLKQLAQVIAGTVRGVEAIRNEMVVASVR